MSNVQHLFPRIEYSDKELYISYTYMYVCPKLDIISGLVSSCTTVLPCVRDLDIIFDAYV